MKHPSIRARQIIFILTLIALILPPLFSYPAASFVRHEPLFPLLLAAYTALLHYFFAPETTASPRPPRLRFVLQSAAGVTTFGGLCVTAACVEIAAAYIPQSAVVMPPLPANASDWGAALLTYTAGAIWEELLYRRYVPEEARALLPERFHRTAVFAGIEVAAILLFAAAHRYLGAIAVINAAIAGTLLRRCYRRTRSVIPGIAAHAAYNIVLFVFYVHTQS